MITKELVDQYFTHSDGKLYWKKVAHPNKQYLVGREAGSIHKTKYRHVTWLGKIHKVHRLIFLIVNGWLPKEIDHINGNRSDNRIDNLRAVTRTENQQNRDKCINNTSGHKGVSWHKASKAWFVRISLNKKSKIIGYFKDLELAALVAEEARIKYHGQYAMESRPQ